jgi:hypothetical protein
VGADFRQAGFVALGAIAGLVITAPSALADPQPPTPPPAPAPAVAAQAASGDATVPPNGMPHLMSPANLPPGTSDAPVDPPESPGLTYLRDLWHAVQNQDISKRDALLLLTQRPMDANSAPPPGVAAGPQAPGPAGQP